MPVKYDLALFSKKLRALRLARGFSRQQDLAEKLGVTQTTVSRWEAGEAEPTTEALLALAELLKVPVNELLKASDAVQDDKTFGTKIPLDVISLLNEIESAEGWDTLRAFLKPFVKLQRRRK